VGGTRLRGIERGLSASDGTLTAGSPTADHRSEGVTAVRVVLAEDLTLLRDGLIRFSKPTISTWSRPSATPLPSYGLSGGTVPTWPWSTCGCPPIFTDERLRAATEVRAENPRLPVLMLSQYVEQLYARERSALS